MRSIFFILAILIFISIPSEINAQCNIQINTGNEICGGTNVEFSIANADPQGTYVWDFNGDGKEDAKGPKVNYPAPKNFGTSQRNVTISVKLNNQQCGTRSVTIKDVPDAALGLPNIEGANLKDKVISVCNIPPNNFEIQLINSSTTQSINENYRIDWGDGSPVVELNKNDFKSPQKKEYIGNGYKNISFTVTGSNGCKNTEIYRYFKGGNPSLNLGSPGNTINLCAPANLTFPVSNTNNNPPGTEYLISVNGVQKLTYTQEKVPSSFDLTFDETSCGKTTSTGKSENAFDVEMRAINPCGITKSTIEPIEVSGIPVAEFSVVNQLNCPGQLFTFKNTTNNVTEVQSGNPSVCKMALTADWDITPGIANVDWRVENGSLFQNQQINVTFLKAGEYTVTMLIKSSACGLKKASKTISIQAAPSADADALFKEKNQCVGEEVSFRNKSTGAGLSFQWTITSSSATPIFINNTNNTSLNPSVRFNQAGRYQIKLEARNVCSVANWDTSIIMHAAPVVNLPRVPDQCERAEVTYANTQINVQTTLPATYKWNFIGGTPIGSTELIPPKVSYAVPGDYIIDFSATNACGTTAFKDTFTVQRPVALSLPKDTTLCRNSAPFVLKAMPGNGKWSGHSAVKENGLLTPKDLPNGETTLTYKFGVGVCQSEGKMKVNVVNPLAVDVGNDRTICTNASPLQLTASQPGGSWSSPNGKIGNQGLFSPGDNSPGNYLIRYALKDGNGCQSQDSLRITTAAPTKVNTQDATFCNTPGLVNLPAATPSGGAWKGTGVVNNTQFDPIAAGGRGNYTVIYTFTDVNGCRDSANAKINIEDAVAIQAGRDTQICASKGTLDLKIGANPSNGRWTDSKQMAINQGLVDLSKLSPGIYVFQYSIGNANCLVKDEKTVEILALPTIDVASNPTQVCLNVDTLRLKATPSAGVWSISKGKIINNLFLPRASGVGTFDLLYQYKDAKGCSQQSSIKLVVNPLPLILANDTTYCNTPGQVTLPIARPSGGVWSGKGVSDNSFSPQQAGGTGTYKLTYTVSDRNNCSNQDTILIVIADPKTIEAGRDTQICISTTRLDLNNGASPTNGRWREQKLGNIPNGIFNPAQYSSGLYTFFYETGTGNCLVSDQKKVEILGLPNLNIDDNSKAVCVSLDSLPLKANLTGGKWQSSAGTLQGSTFYPKRSGAGSYKITYDYQNQQGCSNKAQFDLRVNALPTVNANDTSYCNTPGLVKLPLAQPLNGTWSGTGLNNNQFSPEQAGGVGNYTLIYTFTDQNNCKSSDSARISVVSPQTIDAGADSSFCISTKPFDLDLGAKPVGGRWREEQLGAINQGIFDPAVGARIYTFTYEFGTGNCLVKDQKKIEVLALPVLALNENPSAVCVSLDSLSLKASPAGGKWETNKGNLSGQTFYPKQSGAQDYAFSYQYTDAKGCSNQAMYKLSVNPLPTIKVNDTTYCNTPGAVALPLARPVGGSWSGPGLETNQFSPQRAGGVGNYRLLYSFKDQNNCQNTDSVTINVREPEKIEAGQDEQICRSETMLDLNRDASPVGGQWREEKLGIISGARFNPSVQAPGIYTFTYSIGTGSCAVKDQKQIEVLALPMLSLKNNPSGICVSVDSLILQATPSGGTWSTPKGLLKESAFYAKKSGVGTFQFRYNYTDSKGCRNADSISLNVNGLPKIQAKDTVFCDAPGKVSLPLSKPGGGSWKGPGVVTNEFDPKLAGGVGEYPLMYIFKDAFGCVDSAQIKISVISPPAIEAGTNDTFCIDESPITLKGFSPSNGGKWEGPGIVDANLGTIDLFKAKGGRHKYQFSFGNGNCKVFDAIELTIIDLTSVDAGAVQEACFAATELNLTGAAPLGGRWRGLGVIDSLNGKFSPKLVGEGRFLITYTLIDLASGCTATAKKDIVVHPMPESAFKLPEEACVSGAIKFENTSRSTLNPVWDFGDGKQSKEVSPSHTYRDTGFFQIKLRTTNEFGCVDDTGASIYIFEPPTPVFAMDKREGCAILPVTFKNNSQGYRTRYEWNFGKKQQSTLSEPGTILFQQGRKDTTYIITLVASNACATRQFRDSITVFPIPIAEFGIPIDTNCTPVKATFANTSAGNAEQYFWDLGNGKTWNDSLPPTQVYATDSIPRTFQIRLIATNFCGRDTAIRQLLVSPVTVESFFNIPNPVGCQPFDVQFSNYATPGAFVEWSFGDGNTSALPNPKHTYREPGIYEVVQKASNGCGYDSTVARIEVLPAPVVKFVHPPKVCPNTAVKFTNLSENIAGDFWRFGNQDSSRFKSPVFTFTKSGTYTITLQGISSLNACPNSFSSSIEVLPKPVAIIDTPATTGCVPFKADFGHKSPGSSRFFSWNFGDGNTGAGPKVSHTYTLPGLYEASLIAEDQFGCFSDSARVLITAFPVPPADFSYQQDQPCGVPVKVVFSHNHQERLDYQWSFGNGQQSKATFPQQVFVDTGLFKLSLITTNAYGCRSERSTPLKIYGKPRAGFVIEREVVCTGNIVPITNTSLFVEKYRWSFGDGTASTLRDPDHRYALPGNYRIKLWVSNGSGCKDSIEASKLLPVFLSPFANFDYEEIPFEQKPSGIVQFTDLSKAAIGYTWDFGDGNFSTLQNPEHRFRVNGTKTVRLEVTSANKCTDDTTRIIDLDFFGGLFIPNVMAPDQAQNDARLFLPKGVGLATYHLQIFSTYGDLIWETDELTSEGSPATGWDGTKRGKPLPQDTYVWKIEAKFQNGKVWSGVSNGNGKRKNLGSFLLLR
jgi:large repetitive protein